MSRFLVVLALLVCSSSAFAQSEQDRRNAKRLVGEAQAAFQAEDYELCVEKFGLAFDLAPLPQIQFNLGLCYERLERFRDAALEYEEAAAHPDMPGPMREKAQMSLGKMREQMAEIRIEGGVSEAIVDELIRCKLPCNLFLEPGDHRATWGDEQEQSFSVTRQRAATVTLREEADQALLPQDEDQGQERSDLTSSPVVSEGEGVAWLTWGGGGMAALGTTGAIVFGMKTSSLHQDFMDNPTAALADDGLQARRLTNISIGVALTGAAILAYDLMRD